MRLRLETGNFNVVAYVDINGVDPETDTVLFTLPKGLSEEDLLGCIITFISESDPGINIVGRSVITDVEVSDAYPHHVIIKTSREEYCYNKITGEVILGFPNHLDPDSPANPADPDGR